MPAQGHEFAEFSRRGFLKATGAVTAGSLIFSWAGPPGAAAAEPAGVGPAGVGPAEVAPAADVGFTSTGNPVITSIYTADPDAFVHNGRLYLDTDRDEAALGANDFAMREWHLYSTADLVQWTDHGTRMTLADIGWANRNAWAPQMVQRDGKFFWYIPVQKAATNSMSIGVAVGDSPLGPFTDAIGGPLIDNTTANHSSFDIDPTVLIDDDGQAYLYWGSFSSPRAAKLKRNMIELDDLSGPVGGATGPRVAGRLGTAVRLNGSADHVALPAGIVGGLADFTISVWVNPAATPTWSRVFDFGADTRRYAFLTVNAGAGPRFAITTAGNGAEQQLNRSGQLPANQWSHLAVTLAGNTGTLYLNGAPVATNTAMTLRLSGLGNTTNNWIGRSQFADPFLAAAVDDVHIYNRALTGAEVAALSGGQPGAGNVAAYRFDEAAGTAALDSSGNGRTATVVSPTVKVVTPQGLTGYWEAPYLFKRNGTYYLAYARGNPRTGGNPASIDYATASNPLGPWTYRGRILDTVTNTTTNHSAILEFNGQWYIVYHNGMLPGGGEFRRSVCIDPVTFNADGTIRPVVQTLSDNARRPVAWYEFNESSGSTATDSTGNGWAGNLANGASRAAGLSGTAVRLAGGTQHVGLPTGILWNMYDFTIAGWVRLTATGGHLFDFGTGTAVNMYLAPRGSSGVVRFAITTNGAGGEQRIDGTAPVPTGVWTHLAVTKSALVGTLYVNAVQVGQNANLGNYPARLGNTPNNWIGRSQNAADPYLTGLVDDFRVYQRGLLPAELRALVVDGQFVSLADYLANTPIGGAARNTLTAALTPVRALVRAGRNADAVAALGGFTGQVEQLRGGQLTDEQATQIGQAAQLIRSNIAADMS